MILHAHKWSLEATLAEEATYTKEGHFAKLILFLLQKLYSNGDLNFKGGACSLISTACDKQSYLSKTENYSTVITMLYNTVFNFKILLL